MTIDIGLGMATNAQASPAARRSAHWLAIAAVFATAAWLRLVIPFNVDVSWWLTVSERMLDGQRLYVDILETNPPMPLAIYCLSVVLARATGIRPEVVVDGLIFVLIAASLAWTWHILRSASLRGRAAAGALAVFAAVLLTILPMYDFGQREHLATVAILPAIGVYILRGNHERVTMAAIVIAGVSAAVTMGFKPYFACAVGVCSLAAALLARDWRVLFALENWIAAALTAAYGVGVLVFYPEYFTIIYPLVRDVYLLLQAPLLAIFATTATALSVGAAMIVLILQRREGERDVVSVVVLAAALGFAMAFFLQHKGWGYHAYPMVAFALMAVGCAIAAVDPERAGSRRWRAAAILAVAAMLARACWWFDGGVDVRKIEERVARLAPHPKILMLSAAPSFGFPMVRTLQGTWVSRQEALWVREIVRRARRDQIIDQETGDRLQTHVERERAGLVEDFRKQRPDVVLIDNRDSDWGRWAQADPELSMLLKSYAPVSTIDGVDILERRAP